MILKVESLTTKPRVHCMSFGLLFFQSRFTNKFPAVLKKIKALMLRIKAS